MAMVCLMASDSLRGSGELLIFAWVSVEAGAEAAADLVIGGRFELSSDSSGAIAERMVTMPRGDGTGPTGQGPGTGRGMGRGQGRMGGPYAAGPGGNCICPNCGYSTPHAAGQPCNQKTCPKCGTRMTRA